MKRLVLFKINLDVLRLIDLQTIKMRKLKSLIQNIIARTQRRLTHLLKIGAWILIGLSPPVNLIGQTIKHMKFCNASGVLMIPEWHSAYGQ